MLRKTLLSTAALGAFVVLAFGSGDSGEFNFDDIELPDDNAGSGGSLLGGGAGNAEACRNYVETQNALPCMQKANVVLEYDTMCGAVADSPLDMSKFYTCMAENAKCDGDTPDLAGQADCTY